MNNILELLKTAIIDRGDTGKSDNVPAMLSEGEYVIPADIVSLLGEGNTEAGAGILSTLIDLLRGMQNGPVQQ